MLNTVIAANMNDKWVKLKLQYTVFKLNSVHDARCVAGEEGVLFPFPSFSVIRANGIVVGN